MKTPPIFIITGEQGEGKTTTAIEVVEELKKMGVPVKGFVALGLWSDNVRSGFFIKDLETGNRSLLCKSDPDRDFEKIGRFYFNPKTIAIGEKILLLGKPGELLVIDEIGLFETKGRVWHRVLKELIKTSENPLLITIRKQFVQKVINCFSLKDPTIFELNEDSKEIAQKISTRLTSTV